ncbi:hypothetical protein GW17_00017967 [Ensete ventricosum]|nr:hypothetical protein GW17_00017967 [Ensete ventricosum]
MGKTKYPSSLIYPAAELCTNSKILQRNLLKDNSCQILTNGDYIGAKQGRSFPLSKVSARINKDQHNSADPTPESVIGELKQHGGSEFDYSTTAAESNWEPRGVLQPEEKIKEFSKRRGDATSVGASKRTLKE